MHKRQHLEFFLNKVQQNRENFCNWDLFKWRRKIKRTKTRKTEKEKGKKKRKEETHQKFLTKHWNQQRKWDFHLKQQLWTFREKSEVRFI